jgi:hypothetical protein
MEIYMHKYLVAVGLAAFTTFTALAPGQASAEIQCHDECVWKFTDVNGTTTCTKYLQRCQNVVTPAERAELRDLNVDKKKTPSGLPGPAPSPYRQPKSL